MVGSDGQKQPVYYLHQAFYSAASTWTTAFSAQNKRPPKQAEFNAAAPSLLLGINVNSFASRYGFTPYQYVATTGSG